MASKSRWMRCTNELDGSVRDERSVLIGVTTFRGVRTGIAAGPPAPTGSEARAPCERRRCRGHTGMPAVSDRREYHAPVSSSSASPASSASSIETLEVEPSFLSLSAWEHGGTVFEVVSRRKLDTRQVLPYFVHDGVLEVGVLRRARPSRLLRGAPDVGLEPIGIDFAGVDETGDILHYGDAIFTKHAGVTVDADRLKVPLPSYARSMGYLTALSLPLMVGIAAPPSRDLSVAWDGVHHQICFRTVSDARAMMRAMPHSEDLAIFLGALGGVGAGAG